MPVGPGVGEDIKSIDVAVPLVGKSIHITVPGITIFKTQIERSVGKIVARGGKTPPTYPVGAKCVELRHRNFLRCSSESESMTRHLWRKASPLVGIWEADGR